VDVAHNTVAGSRKAAEPAPSSGAREGAAAPSASNIPPSSRATRPSPPRPTVAQFIADIRAAFTARFHLFELEAKRAALSGAYMLAFAVGAALLGVTAWLILIGALIVGAVSVGVHWLVAVAIAIALHAAAVFFLVRAIRGMVDNLTFAGTRRTLTSSEHVKGEDGGSV